MILPSKDSIMLLDNDSIHLSFLHSTKEIYHFHCRNIRKYTYIRNQLERNKTFKFITFADNKIIRWKGILSGVNQKNLTLVIKEPVIYDINFDERKERYLIKEKVEISDIHFNNKLLDFNGKKISGITHNVSLAGVLISSSLDLSTIYKKDKNHRIILKFNGQQLKQLAQTEVSIKRYFRIENMFYYGCSFDMNNQQEQDIVKKIILNLPEKYI